MNEVLVSSCKSFVFSCSCGRSIVAGPSELRLLFPPPEEQLHLLQQNRARSVLHLRSGGLHEGWSGRVCEAEPDLLLLEERSEAGGGLGSCRRLGHGGEGYQAERRRPCQLGGRRRSSERRHLLGSVPASLSLHPEWIQLPV